MSDIMRPIPFESMLNWIIDEFLQNQTIFSYPEQKFFIKKTQSSTQLFGENLETPLGPAAGPHTQMAQNIIVAYLSGGRFFELKTVQKLDKLNIPRPCIEAQDEGYNVEWSQELLLEQSFDEYLKAWFILHLLQAIFTGKLPDQRQFIFNMSVGYDLAGIKTPRMDKFINNLIDASQHASFSKYKTLLLTYLKKNSIQQKLRQMHKSTGMDEIIEAVNNIPPDISTSVTVSTMHGCPPDEIEAICNYLLKEKHMHTYVKLNPTLLGFERVNRMLQDLGYRYVQLDQAAFEHDLQYADAVPMLRRLQETAAKEERVFGVKLSNTLGMKNSLKHLPGDEMYMSGRALFPLTISLAAKLTAEFGGQINISYSGGASAHNVLAILKTGIAPVTMVTDLLKPGGYARLQQMAERVDAQPWPDWLQQNIDVNALQNLAESCLNDPYYQKERREVDSIKIKKSLPLFDCYLAPCQEACPIHQDVAAYIRLVEEGRYLDALRVIIETNPLPHITGYICDHQCMYHCTRWDYDDPVYIREMKKVAAEQAWNEFLRKYGDKLKPSKFNGIQVAIIGAGPSGLSAAYFLARSGFEVTVVEKEQQAGGVVRNVIPDFRLPQHAIDRDVELIQRHGVRFRFGVTDVTVQDLITEGFKYIFVAIGAGKSRKLQLNPANGMVLDALEFLHKYKQKKPLQLGEKVAVIGGGNSAMDAARAARRIPGVREVSIIYRRTREFMPADREELEAALQDGVQIKELLLPVALENGILTCQKMALGEKGSDGRRQVRPIDGAFETFQIDALISAIGEQVDKQFLQKNNLQIKNKNSKTWVLETNLPNVFIGGDALRGPSTVVESIADGKKAAEIIISKEKQNDRQPLKIQSLLDRETWTKDLQQRKGLVVPFEATDHHREAARCLACDVVCDKCIEVCPNRANMALPLINKDMFKDHAQILHIDGLCNECGNCETFCPYQGKPYEDKITLFWSKEDFDNSRNEGFLLVDQNNSLTFWVRFKGVTGHVILDRKGKLARSDWQENTVDFKALLTVMQEIVRNHAYLLLNN